MGVTFTKEQQEVIDLRDCNILVSAAAGSGKTAVLTERIVNMVCDEEHPVDIDRLLVVTFTSAAAAEMRERIRVKLNERLLTCPDSEYVQRQITLLYHAQITTIDSFCLFLIKNHFHEIGLDPAFRVLDEREVKLIAREAIGELLEDAYAEGKEEFLNAVEVLCPNGKDSILEEHILNMSRYAASFPWPEEWLLERKQDYALDDPEAFQKTAIWNYAKHYVVGILKGCAEKMNQGIRIVQEPDGPYMYGKLLEEERDRLGDLLNLEDFEELGRRLSAFSFGRLPSKKDDSVDAAKREQVKSLRDEVKKILVDLRGQFFAWPMEITLSRGKACAEVINVLVDLVLDFDRRMREKKREKKGIDFSDMEHYALDILLQKKEGQVVPSPVALQYREYFQEVLIDEYQDSNLVQEYILKAVSGEEDGNYNRFMVGDVKQSIYRFRLARPELFMDKYKSYQKEGPLRRVDLSKNFRSRETVISTVNELFGRMMSKDVGGIEYDEDASLHKGAEYPLAVGMESVMLAVEKPWKGAKIKTREAEALAIAGKIKAFMKTGKVTDKNGMQRNAAYRDVVILLRSLTGWGDIFKETLEKQGIPAHVTSKKGYFTATEVQSLLNYLRVIENPYQDIPLYGVLHSAFGGFTEDEIAEVRAVNKKKPLYEQLKESDREKCIVFLKRLQEYRSMSAYMTTRELLERITWDYDYLNYVTALPGGQKRRANVEMLFVKASDFEKTSYYGLFHFIRYMEQLEKFEEDYGEADTLDENADVVRIMSIHKSKGLEFPVVFVAGLAKGFNMQDLRAAVILDVDLGIGMDYIDGKRRIKGKTFRKNAVALRLREDMMAEELRLLYVAMTRAKEKLILTAEMEKPEETMRLAMENAVDTLSYLDFMKASTYMDFLLPVLGRVGIEQEILTVDKLTEDMAGEQLDLAIAKESLKGAKAKVDPTEYDMIKERLQFQYPFQTLKGLYTKTTVSELKIAAMEEKDEGAYHLFEDREMEEYVPEFRREKGEKPGSVRGDAYHKVMELLDYQWIFEGLFDAVPENYDAFRENVRDGELLAKVDAFLREKVTESKLSEEYRELVNTGKVCKFLKAEIGYRMWRASQDGKLRREQPFVLSLPAKRLDALFPEEESVLIQGIIDAYFEEDGELVLLDYKTDHVDDMDALWKRYRTQIDYYREALERLTGMKVKQEILYSFHLGSC